MFAESAIPTAMKMVFAYVVFASERMLKVPRAFIERSASRTATVTMVHAGFHFSLAFNHAKIIALSCDSSELLGTFVYHYAMKTLTILG